MTSALGAFFMFNFMAKKTSKSEERRLASQGIMTLELLRNRYVNGEFRKAGDKVRFPEAVAKKLLQKTHGVFKGSDE